MKKIYLLGTVLLSPLSLSNVYASGFMTCDLEATVKQIQAIGVLDDTVSLNRISQTDSYRYVATIDITSSVRTAGLGDCPTGQILIALKQCNQVKVGDEIKIEYRNAHDRPGHSETYELK